MSTITKDVLAIDADHPTLPEVIRTIGLYQPYASLMLHGKIESRWVLKGKRPPFPLGKYLIYSTIKFYPMEQFADIAGPFCSAGWKAIEGDQTEHLRGKAIAVGDLVEVRPFMPGDCDKAFVELGQMVVQCEDHVEMSGYNKKGHYVTWQLWALIFKNVSRINPLKFKGKQGVGFLKEPYLSKIKYLI